MRWIADPNSTEKNDDELSDDELDDVSGGGLPPTGNPLPPKP